MMPSPFYFSLFRKEDKLDVCCRTRQKMLSLLIELFVERRGENEGEEWLEEGEKRESDGGVQVLLMRIKCLWARFSLTTHFFACVGDP